ncbi:IS256 family transposase, partial [Bowdeniella massiliensis]
MFDKSLPGRPSGQDLVDQLKASGQLDALFAQIDAGEVELTGDGGFVPALVKAALERGLQAELTSHLGYEKGAADAAAHANSRNGTTSKTVHSEVGPITLDVPRDRDGSFSPRLVPKGQRRLGGLDDMIISLYAGGMTIRDIQHHLASTIGTDLSHETISNITDAVSQEVMAWQARPLEEFYPVIYLDAIRVKIRENSQVLNRAAYLAVGVDLEGIKHVLGIWVQDTEGSAFWAHVCADLANRGVADVLIVCCDGLQGLPEA